MEKNMEMISNKKTNMINKLSVFLMLGLMIIGLVGCKDENPLQKAAELYEQKNYITAETYFIDAIRTGENSLTAYIGYGFNELARGDYDGATSIFKLILAVEAASNNLYGDETYLADDVRRGLYESYVGLGRYKEAVEVLRELAERTEDKEQKAFYRAEASSLAWKNSEESSDEMTEEEARELVQIISESIEAGNDNIKNYRMRANLYYKLEEWDLWEKDERTVIGFLDYAHDEWLAIYSVYCEHKTDLELLPIIDEIVVYMNAHSDYVDSYENLIAIIMNAADITGYVEYENNADYYFNLAEEYLDKADLKKNMSESLILKYRIIIAEHKGKMELAYKLLGVYLEHCPDDEKAIKEKLYLENRIGVAKE